MIDNDCFNKHYEVLKEIAEKSLGKNKYEKALQAISAAADLSYRYNQFYVDNQLEKMLQLISKSVCSFSDWKKTDNKTVLFYDAFGVDRRGIAIVVNKAICLNNYNLVYVCPLVKKNKQPTFEKVMCNYKYEWRYLDDKKTYIDSIKDLNLIFEETKPDVAFLYTTPYDVAGITVFNALKDKCLRIQLDLTDHAFWLGLNAFDICNGGRQFSACIQHLYRGIPLEKMTQLDANLFVDDCPLQKLPFDEENRFIFSGGALYKTLGDNSNTFYRIVNHILSEHDDVKFLYAGNGNDSQMKLLIDKYPGRVFLIDERPDFYQIIQRCTLYLNTYPMFGGLMMRYAALAGKLPITLRHKNDSDGILIDQASRNIEYDTYDELINDVDRLLNDPHYLKKRESLLDGAVVSEDCFVRNIKLLIEEHRTEFPYDEVKKVDVKQFQQEFKERFTYFDICKAIAKKRNLKLAIYFPKVFMSRLLYKLKSKARK